MVNLKKILLHLEIASLHEFALANPQVATLGNRGLLATVPIGVSLSSLTKFLRKHICLRFNVGFVRKAHALLCRSKISLGNFDE